ncbi:hypothetical protein [Halopiger thermotolerans]
MCHHFQPVEELSEAEREALLEEHSEAELREEHADEELEELGVAAEA